MAYKAPKGTKDVLPEESYRWQYLERTIRAVVKKYGLLEARTPCIEHTELFLRGVGDTTDIVQKEMYTFTDKGDRSITLKPEGTAGAVRMFVENGLFSEAQPTKMYYLYCPVFRYERPQAGRLREHHQFGVEIFGSPSPAADAEAILIASDIFETLGCSDLTIKLNSIGCPKCRSRYQQALKDYLGVGLELGYAHNEIGWEYSRAKYSMKGKLSYSSFDIPLTVGYTFAKGNFRITPHVGAYASIPIGDLSFDVERVESDDNLVSEKTSVSTMDISSKFLFGGVGGVGIGYKVGKGLVNLDARFMADFPALKIDTAKSGVSVMTRRKLTLGLSYVHFF